jgi:hypothetical protein
MSYRDQPIILPHWLDAVSNIADAITSFKKSCEILASADANSRALNTGLSSTTVQSNSENLYIHLESNLARLRTLESKLRSARTSLLQLRNSSKSLVSVAVLPDAVLGNMFSMGVENEASYGKPVHPFLQFPRGVSHVCTRWRLIALRTPSLWTYLSFDDAPLFSRTRQWIMRSGTALLHPRFDLGSNIPSDKQRNASFQLAVAHYQRWKSLSLYGSHDTLRRTLMTIPSLVTIAQNQDSPHNKKLITLQIHQDHDFDYKRYPGPLIWYEPILQLVSTIECTSFAPFAWNPAPLLPFLRELTISQTRFPPDGVLRALSGCPSLRKIVLSHCTDTRRRKLTPSRRLLYRISITSHSTIPEARSVRHYSPL